MSLLGAITTQLTDAATAVGFVDVLDTTPREMQGRDLPGFYLRLVKVRDYRVSPGLDPQQITAEVEVVVMTPEPADAPAVASGPLAGSAFGGRSGARAAHDLALAAFGAAEAKPTRMVQYAGPTGGRDVFVTAFYVTAHADVFNDL